MALEQPHAVAVTPATGAPYTSRFLSAPDGLRLHLRDYGPRLGPKLPIVCLPGLTRPSGDFHTLASHLAGAGHRVLALDYRGRGLSAWDKRWRNYDVFVESADIQSLLVAQGVVQAIFIGTSRGGLHILALAALRPSLIAAAVLNDIGPVIEAAGLARIKATVGQMKGQSALPATPAEAVTRLKTLFGNQFTAASEDDWVTYAALTYPEREGRIVPGFDPRLLKTLDALDLTKPLPVLWPQFDGLACVPRLVIRGANSDLLSAETYTAMLARPSRAGAPPVEGWVVEGQGHAPLLMDAPTLARIADFVSWVGQAGT